MGPDICSNKLLLKKNFLPIKKNFDKIQGGRVFSFTVVDFEHNMYSNRAKYISKMWYNFSNVSLVKQNTLSALDLDHPEITDYFDDYVDDHNAERLKARNHDNNFDTLLIRNCTLENCTHHN